MSVCCFMLLLVCPHGHIRAPNGEHNSKNDPPYLRTSSLQSQKAIYGDTTGFSFSAHVQLNMLRSFSSVGALPSGYETVTSMVDSGQSRIRLQPSIVVHLNPQMAAILCVLFWMLCHGELFDTKIAALLRIHWLWFEGFLNSMDSASSHTQPPIITGDHQQQIAATSVHRR